MILALIGFFVFALGLFFFFSFDSESVLTPSQNISQQHDVIKVGILHSLTGTMASSELPVLNATLFAIEEINSKGGLLDKKIVPIIYDGESNGQTFASRATDLLKDDNVSVIFGGWTSASRKSMIPVLDEYDAVLFYPVQYEGLESRPNILYLGAAPNQQVIPGIIWAQENLGTKFFLVGSDYVFPYSANTIIKDYSKTYGFDIVGEEYALLGAKNFVDIVANIKKTNPDVIINTINGDSNEYFFKELRKQGITSDLIPTMSFSLSQSQISNYAVSVEDDYLVWNYFENIPSYENRQFVSNIKKTLGSKYFISDSMEAAYVGIYLYAKAVEKANSFENDDVLDKLKQITFSAPSGITGIDPTNHVYKTMRIGKILSDGQVEIIFSSQNPIPPNPYPDTRTVGEWNDFLNYLYAKWGNSWENQS